MRVLPAWRTNLGSLVLLVSMPGFSLLLPRVLSAQQSGPPPVQQQPAPDPHAAQERSAEAEALGFLQDLDRGRYSESYAYTSRLIRSKMDRKQFVAAMEKDRAPAGAMQSRKLGEAVYTTTLQSVSPGQYVVLHYNTNFAKKTGAIETMTMSYENGYWRVAGWYLK